MEGVLDCAPVIKSAGLEAVVSELRRGLEGFEAQRPAGVNPLFGAVQGFAAGRPAQVN